MITLGSGTYQTKKGSTVEIYGSFNGSFLIDFDWVEEGACIEATPSILEDRLIWQCECCGSCDASLKPFQGKAGVISGLSAG